MRIICISGKAQHGKDTTAKILKEVLEKNGERVLITHYADLLKYICKTFFEWNGEKDDVGRAILQRVGTDVIRKKAPNYWVDFIVNFIELFPDEWDYILIPDTRFPNEVEAIVRRFDATHIRVERPEFMSPLTAEQQRHISETALDDYFPDYYIYNGGSIEDLEITVNTYVREVCYGIRE